MEASKVKIYNKFNALVLKFLTNLRECFPLDCITTEIKWLHGVLALDYKGVENVLKRNLSKIAEQIHCQNKDVLLVEDSPLLDHLCIRQVFPLFHEDELVDFWRRLREIVEQIGLVESVSGHACDMVSLLQSFQQKHPEMKVDQTSKFSVIKQMMADKTFAQDLMGIFNDPNEETSIFGHLPEKMRMMGLTAVQKEGCEIEDITEETPVEVEGAAPSAGDMMKKRLQARQKHKAKKGNMFKEIADAMDEKKIDAPDFSELGKGISEMFDGSNSDTAGLAEFMADISAGNIPEGMPEGSEDLLKQLMQMMPK